MVRRGRSPLRHAFLPQPHVLSAVTTTHGFTCYAAAITPPLEPYGRPPSSVYHPTSHLWPLTPTRTPVQRRIDSSWTPSLLWTHIFSGPAPSVHNTSTSYKPTPLLSWRLFTPRTPRIKRYARLAASSFVDHYPSYQLATPLSRDRRIISGVSIGTRMSRTSIAGTRTARRHGLHVSPPPLSAGTFGLPRIPPLYVPPARRLPCLLTPAPCL